MNGKRLDFKDLETLARENQWPEVEKLIKAADRRYYLEQDLIDLATMARRAYRLSFSHYLLKPIVLTPDNQILKNANPLALAEYAIVQTMLGGRKKAKELLETLPNKTEKEHFAWVTYYFSLSDYTMAIPHLEASIGMEKDPYKKNLAQLNLASCLVSSQKYDEAKILLFPLKSFFENNHYTLLQANTEELLGQISIHTNEWDKAAQYLNQAQKLMTGNNKLYSLFIEKWQLVCKMKKNQLAKSQLQQFIEKAKTLKHTHTIRETLFYWGHFNNDFEILSQIHFGTPFWSYRDFMKSITGFQNEKEYFLWGNSDEKIKNVVDIKKMAYNELKLSNQELKLLMGLSRDFYEPLTISALFYEVYPDEYFDYQYSTSKTYKLIQRINKKFKQANVGLHIVNSESSYHLSFQPGWALKVPNPDLRQKENAANFNLLNKFQGTPFSRQDVMDQFQLSRSSALRWLKDLQEEGKVLKMGQGPGSFYRIAS